MSALAGDLDFVATLLKLYYKPQINPVQIFTPSSGRARKRPIFELTDLTKSDNLNRTTYIVFNNHGHIF